MHTYVQLQARRVHAYEGEGDTSNTQLPFKRNCTSDVVVDMPSVVFKSPLWPCAPGSGHGVSWGGGVGGGFERL